MKVTREEFGRRRCGRDCHGELNKGIIGCMLIMLKLGGVGVRWCQMVSDDSQMVSGINPNHNPPIGDKVLTKITSPQHDLLSGW